MTAQIRPPVIVGEIDALFDRMRLNNDWQVLRYETPAHVLWLFRQYRTVIEGDQVFNFANTFPVCTAEIHYDRVTGEVTAYRAYPDAAPEPIDWRIYWLDDE